MRPYPSGFSRRPGDGASYAGWRGGVMDEGTNKAIPLRRSRTRALTVRSRTWSDSVTAGVRRVLDPPRQVWLASLGGPALMVRGIRGVWARLVAEGAEVEASVG